MQTLAASLWTYKTTAAQSKLATAITTEELQLVQCDKSSFLLEEAS